MSTKSIFGFLGLLIGAVVNLLINLISAGIQNKKFSDQFTMSSIIWLTVLALLGLIIGWWLGTEVTVQLPASTTKVSRKSTGNRRLVIMTRLRAFLSLLKFRGQGIKLSDVFTLGSRIDVDTRDEEAQ